MSLESTPSTLAARPSTFCLPKSIIWIGAAVLAWFALSEVATEAWYHFIEKDAGRTTPWIAKLPSPTVANEEGFNNFREQELGDREKELLRFDRSLSAMWTDGAGHQWAMFDLEWKPDKRLNSVDISHNPTTCIGSTGWDLLRRHPSINLEINGLSLEFQVWEFARNDARMFVFVSTRREYKTKPISYNETWLGRRMEQVFKPFNGVRGNPLQTLEILVVGENNYLKAKEGIGRFLGLIVNPA